MAERLRRMRVLPRRLDAGFSMLEIVVAIAILGIAMAAAGPQMVGAVKAAATAKVASQAKGVLQGQLDAMRTLPFHVGPAAGAHRDLIDTYYRDLVPPSVAPVCGTPGLAEPLSGWTGYVAPTNTARCPYEPPSGPFYRTVLPTGRAGVPPGFALVLNTTFVPGTANPTVLTPPAGYHSQVAGRDSPPSSQVGVTATVLTNGHGRWKPFTVYTQIASRTAAETRIQLDARATAVEIGSSMLSGESITMAGGQLDFSGSLSTTSQARANLSAIGAASSLSGRRDGAAAAVRAPYTGGHTTAGAGDLAAACTAPCWGPSTIPAFSAAADFGLPRVGIFDTSGQPNPVQTHIPESNTRSGFEFRAESPVLPGLSSTLVSMDPEPPASPVRDLYNCAFPAAAPASRLTGSGYINSTDETAAANAFAAEACSGAHADVIRVLPTSFAPGGLIRITARSAARCLVAGLSHVATAAVSYRAEVQYWKWTPASPGSSEPGHGEYVSAGSVTPTSTTDPLAAISLATRVSDTRVLGDYIESITGLTSDRVTAMSSGHVAQATIPALVAVQTQPIAGGANLSTAISIAVGAASCRAEDNR